MKLIKGIGAGALGLLGIILQLIAWLCILLIYGLTLYVAFTGYNFVAGLFALVFPIISTIGLAIIIAISYGFINFHLYTIILFVIALVCWGVMLLCVLIADKAEEKKNMRLAAERRAYENSFAPAPLPLPRMTTTVTAVHEDRKTLDESCDEIRKYKQLLDEGIITQEEYDSKKKDLLGL